MPNGTYSGVRGRKTKVGRKLLRFPPTRFLSVVIILPGELLQTDKHQHKYHNLCKFQGR